jgi:hypothetical protein
MEVFGKETASTVKTLVNDQEIEFQEIERGIFQEVKETIRRSKVNFSEAQKFL